MGQIPINSWNVYFPVQVLCGHAGAEVDGLITAGKVSTEFPPHN